MRDGEVVIADRVLEATILFCDLVGFTKISHELPAERVIDLLSRIFADFDRLASEHGVEKIKTIGDAYMVAAGIPEPQADHALRIARFALRMLEVVDAIAVVTDVKLEARVGVHTGPIVAGVIGTHKFAYDVWGDTVNTAEPNGISIHCPVEFRSLPRRGICSANASILKIAGSLRSRVRV